MKLGFLIVFLGQRKLIAFLQVIHVPGGIGVRRIRGIGGMLASTASFRAGPALLPHLERVSVSLASTVATAILTAAIRV